MKNVIFIVVDTLRYDHLGYGGNKPSPSPNIDHLMSGGLCATNGFATGCPTSMALPAIFTSTLPLDRGGYDQGIVRRKGSIVEIFKKAGYKTIGFYPGLETDGYDRSFDLFFRSVFPSFISSSLNYFLRPVLENYVKFNMNIHDCVRILVPSLPVCFADIKTYCNDKAMEFTEKQIIASPFMHNCGVDYSKIYDMVCDEEKKFSSNPSGYIKKLIRARALNAILKKVFKIEIRRNDFFDKLLMIQGIIEKKNYQEAKKNGDSFQKDSQDFRFEQLVSNVASAGYIMENLYRWVDRDRESPFFAYVHFFDVHPPCNFISYDMQGSQLEISKEMNVLGNLYYEIGAKDKGFIPKDTRYAFSIKYVDEKIKDLLTFLKNRNILNDTIIVVTSDHGTNYPGVPPREGVHVIKSFYDEFYRIPIVFFNKDIKPRVFNGLCSSMDIAPTLLDIVGLEIPSSFKGKSFAGESTGRDYVIMEHMGAGLCDFNSKPIIISLRTSAYKLVYEMKLPRRGRGASGVVKQFFNIQNDPLEQNNLSDRITNAELSNTVKDLIAIAEARIQEIKIENEMTLRLDQGQKT